MIRGRQSPTGLSLDAGASFVPGVRLAVPLLISGLALITTLPLIAWLPAASWHDQQRIGQILVMMFGLIALGLAFPVRSVGPVVDRSTRWGIVCVVAAGLASAALAHRPTWALVEVALAVGTLGLGWTVAVTRRRFGTDLDHALLVAVFFVCAGLTAQFFVGYVSALTNGAGLLDVWLLLEGFSNPRFYGQFLTLAMPVLAAPLLATGRLRRFAPAAATLLTLVWMIAIASGTRATWLGMIVAAVWLAWTGVAGRRWAAWQAATAGTGVLLFWISMGLVPQWAGMETANTAARMTASLSLRDVIWLQAVEMIANRPLLGYGPMHFADIPNRIAAHPHQAWLQWAAEWGVPSALVVTWLVARSARAVFRVLRAEGHLTEQPHVLRVCLAGSITAAIAHAMVDGVLVMPYSQLWLALLGGWLLGLHSRIVECQAPAHVWRAGWRVSLVAAVGILVFVTLRDHPYLFEREQLHLRTVGGQLQPRFWAQGVIARQGVAPAGVQPDKAPHAGVVGRLGSSQ